MMRPEVHHASVMEMVATDDASLMEIVAPDDASQGSSRDLSQVASVAPDTHNVGASWAGNPVPALQHNRQRLVPPPLIPIPNIIVEPVPARDAFGHSRTPPFVTSPSEWVHGGRELGGSSRWRLAIPGLGRKPRALSDSSILALEKQAHVGTPPPTALNLSPNQQPSVFNFENLPRDDTEHSSASPVPMETCQASLVNAASDMKSSISGSSGSASTGGGVPVLWHFHHLHASGLEKSPKTYWLRRHSDSTVPGEADNSPDSSIRSHSTGDCTPDSPAPSLGASRLAHGVSPLALSSCDETTPREVEQEVGELENAVVNRRLKLKKYLQKRYQLSQRRRQLSSDTDDVFSDNRGPDTPSPHVATAPKFLFRHCASVEESQFEEQRKQASEEEPCSELVRVSKPPALNLQDPVQIKLEPIGTSEPETPVFMSPCFPLSQAPVSADSALADWSAPSMFQFRSGSLDLDGESVPSTPAGGRLVSGGRGIRPRRQAAVDSPDPMTVEVGRGEDVKSGGRVENTSTLPPFSTMLQSSPLPLLTSSFPASHSGPPFSTGPIPSSWVVGGGHGVGGIAAPPLSTSPLSTSSLSPSALSSSCPTSPAIIRTNKTESSKIIYCPFSEQVQEQRHSRDPNTTFMCPVCGQVFPSYNYLANHMVNHLPSEVVSKGPGDSSKVHLCKVCNRSFSRSDMLTRHMRLHTGLRPYECRTCGQVFSRSDHLHTHLRTHTGEKPYRCPQCPYAAPRRDMITRHMRIHMKHFSPRRGRRSSSTSSSQERISPDRPMSTSVDHPGGDVRHRNQSLSSVESIDSSLDHSPFRRHSSSADLLEVESLVSKRRSWSATSEGSTDYGPSDSTQSPHHLIPQPWSLGSTESTDYPSPREPPSPPYRHPPTLQRRFFFQTGGSSSSGDSIEGIGFGWKGRSMEVSSEQELLCGKVPSHHPLSPVLSPTRQELSPGSEGISAEIQTSFQKCTVTSDIDSGSEQDMVMPLSSQTSHPTH